MNMIDIIRAEIERRKTEAIGFRNAEKREDWASFFNGEATALENLLSFLSTLESEKPINQDELEKEIEKFLNKTGAPYVWCNDDEQKEWCSIIARHFAKWQKEQIMKEAVEEKVAERVQGKLYARCQVPKTMGVEFGDKVRVIVLKKED